MPPNLSFQRTAELRLSYESIDVNYAVTTSGAPHSRLVVTDRLDLYHFRIADYSGAGAMFEDSSNTRDLRVHGRITC